MAEENGTPERIRVLFVDDEENVLNSLQRLFIDSDYEILTAQSGEEGLEILGENEVAVIVSDQRMPKMTGAEFLQKAVELSPDSVRMVLTGHADIGAVIDAINKGGAHRYISKPWNNDDLLLAVRSSVERYLMAKENKYLNELTKRQKEDLEKWNGELEILVQQQTIDLTRKNRELVDMNGLLVRNFRDFVITISNLIELRDVTVGNHSNNVAALSRGLAKKAGLGDKEITNVSIAAQLHDIGKIGVPDTILLKDADTLSAQESWEYRKHPVRGQAAMESNDSLRDAGALVRSHHESMDGKGFPDQLKGEAIPIGSRIIAIADRYDRLALTRAPEIALEEMRATTARQLDVDLFHLFAGVALEMADSLATLRGAGEREIHPDAVLPGMVLSRDLRSGTGVLLIAKGTEVRLHHTASIQRYYRVDPPERGVFVYAERPVEPDRTGGEAGPA